MSLLKNAVESIQIGVEDYLSDDHRRHLSAVRNVSAGILLLFKHKLREMSPDDPDLLIKAQFMPKRAPDGSIKLVGVGKRTVDVQQLKERFKQLGVGVDWKLFDAVNEIRNDVEHYYSAESKDAIRDALAKCFVLLRDFLLKELHEEPRELLGEECWSDLLKVSEVFATEQAACRATLAAIDWSYPTLRECITAARCPACGSPLVRTDETGTYNAGLELNCASCGNIFDAGEIVEACLDETYGADAHIAIKDGGDPPYGECPNCNTDTFSFAEGVCLVCENTLPYTRCEWCGEPLTHDEQPLEGLCSYCTYKRDKARAE